MKQTRIVITGIGLTAPNGNSLAEFRQNLLTGVSGVTTIEVRYMGRHPAGMCTFDPLKYQKKKDVRIGTRVGGISIYCAREALADSGVDLATRDKSRVGIYLGVTEHGNVETENEVYNISQFKYDTKFWSHHHNPRTVANNAAGEVSLNLGITGPAYTIGAACAAGNVGLIHAAQMLRLGEVDLALAGGVSESPQTFGIFAGFKSQNALAAHEDPKKASRPFDEARNGIVISEGGCIYTIERLEDAQARGAKIYGELTGYGATSDGEDMVAPSGEGAIRCMQMAMSTAKRPLDYINTHGTSTPVGDVKEIGAIRSTFAGKSIPAISSTKSLTGHSLGATGVQEAIYSLLMMQHDFIAASAQIDNLDPAVADMPIVRQRIDNQRLDAVMSNSFGFGGTNATLVFERYEG